MISGKIKLFILSIFFLLNANAIQAQDTLQIPRAQKPPVLSEYLQSAPENAGLEVSDFKQRIPNDGSPASKSTKAYLSFDDNYFYAVFIAKDDPELIRARIAKREDIFGDDFVILDLDTFHDKKRSFTFFVNPYGVQLDAKRTDGLDIDRDFDNQWQSEGQLTADGYVVKMVIPFKSLRFNNANVQTWGIALGRRIERLNEVSFWPHLSIKVAGFVSQMASITIPEKLTAGRNLQINPFIYAGKSHILNADNSNKPFWVDQNKIQGGLDAKWVVGDTMAIDLTLKPDFSEVESDEPQILIDKRYEVLLPEKRPFFLENSGFFSTPIPLFFSRRISKPTAGIRLTGRKNTWSYGGLLIDDQAPIEEKNNTQNADKNAHITMARLQNDLTDKTSIGVITTDRRFENERNTVLGLDIQHQLNDNWVLKGQTANSRTVVFNKASTQGKLGYAEANHQGRDVVYLAKYLDVTPDFDTSLAFVPRKNIRQLYQEGLYQWHYEGHDWLQATGVTIKSELTRNHQNQLQDWWVDAGFVSTMIRNTWFELYARKSFEKYDAHEYQKQGWLINAGANWWNWLGVTAEIGMNDNINYSPTIGQSAFLGNGRSLNLTVTLKPHPQWRIEEKILWSDLQTKNQINLIKSGNSVYRDLLFRTKITYQHDRFLGFRLITDYHSLNTNPQLSALKSGKQLNTDIQLSYVLSPGTTIYTGYGNRQENLELIGNPTHVQNTENLSLRTGSRVFIKLNYLYQL